MSQWNQICMYLKMSTCQNFIVITSLLTVTLLFKVISESDSLEKFAEKKWWYSVELRSGGIGSMQWCIVSEEDYGNSDGQYINMVFSSV